MFQSCFEFIGELHQRGLSAIVSCCTFDKTAAAGVHYTDIALDVRSELQSLALRLPAHRHVVLHLRHYWNAGLYSKKDLTRFNVNGLTFFLFFAGLCEKFE